MKVLLSGCPPKLLHEAHDVEGQFKIDHAVLRGKSCFYHTLLSRVAVFAKVKKMDFVTSQSWLSRSQIRRYARREGRSEFLFLLLIRAVSNLFEDFISCSSRHCVFSA